MSMLREDVDLDYYKIIKSVYEGEEQTHLMCECGQLIKKKGHDYYYLAM